MLLSLLLLVAVDADVAVVVAVTYYDSGVGIDAIGMALILGIV